MKRWTWLLAGLVGLLSVRAGTLVQFRTIFGDVEMEMYDQEKPVTVQNFLQYVKDGAYTNNFFHRQVPNFIIQGGAYGVTNRGTTNSGTFEVVTRPPITNEYAFGPLISNTAGTIAMAKTSDPNSATSQFFFNLTNNAASLDNTNNSGGFTVFGHLVGGTNAFKLFNSFILLGAAKAPWTNVVVNVPGSPFSELPILMLRTNEQTHQPFVTPDDTVIMEISALTVAVRPLATGAREISWDAVHEATNIVEYTVGFPPQWQTLETLVKPEPPRAVVVDPATDSNRFYRIRAEF